MTEQEYRDKVYAEAKEVRTPEALTKFLADLSEHGHDYGTIIYACSAAMRAAFGVVNASPQGGITGFQAGAIMWEMVREFGMFSEGPLRIVDYDNLRYPQYDEKFRHTISRESADTLIERAKAFGGDGASDAVARRNAEIARGEFPAFVTITDES